MTRVLWVTPSYPWADDPIGGIFYRHQARALLRSGVDVVVAVPTPWAPWPLARLAARWRRHAESPGRERLDGVDVHRPRYLAVPREPALARADVLMARSIVRSVRSLPPFDLVHGHYAITGIAASRVAHALGRPYVLSFNGDDINTWPDQHPRQRPELITAIRRSALTVSVSRALGERVRDLSGTDPLTLPIGIDHDEFAGWLMPRAAARAAIGESSDAFIALFVGRLEPAKGLDEFVDGVLSVGAPVVGVLIGVGPAAARAQEHVATGRIRLLGRRTNQEVAMAMCAADVIVLASRGEGMPTVLIEAGSAGLPVIASAVGGIPELLLPDRGTVLPAISGPAVAQAIRANLVEPARAAEQAERLRQHVHLHYDVHRNAAHLARQYDSIVGAGQRSGAA